MTDMPPIVGPIDESTSGRSIAMTEDASDPSDKPKACADPWTWRKGAEWKKGHAANPTGKNQHTYRNKAARAAESLFDGEVEHLTRRCVDMALAGDPQAMRICMDRLLPPVKSRPFKFKIPELRTIADAQNALSTIIAATACGAILSDDAATLASIISAFVRTTEVAELESRLCALEKANAGAPMERIHA